MTRRALLALLANCLAGAFSPADASPAIVSIAVGYNGRPPASEGYPTTELRFADDDALAVHAFARIVARRSFLLTLPDRATLSRSPLARDARPPSLTELRVVLAEARDEIDRAKRAGEKISVWLFYSGHGWIDSRGQANLTLADGALSQGIFYGEVLPALAGQPVHLMIDACHAEAMIRPRDLTAETVEVSSSELAAASLRSRLDALPNVGVLMASARNTQAHEWDEYQMGVFTHELLSGLRGGADVNGDGRLEYSEIAAFLTAANREVKDPRARLTTLALPPKLYPRAAIVDLTDATDAATLQGGAHHLGRFQVDDHNGNRLLDLRTENGYKVKVLLPAGERILVSNDGGEASLVLSAHSTAEIERLELKDPSTRRRSAMGESMLRGLFAAEFGPAYYRGYIDSSETAMLPVDIGPAEATSITAKRSPERHHPAAWSAFGLGAVALAAAGYFGVATINAYGDFDRVSLERESMAARDRVVHNGLAAVSAGAVGLAATALGYWLWQQGR